MSILPSVTSDPCVASIDELRIHGILLITHRTLVALNLHIAFLFLNNFNDLFERSLFRIQMTKNYVGSISHHKNTSPPYK